MASARARAWCFTRFFEPRDFVVPPCEYGVWQLEKAPETGREHVQGYLQFAQPKSQRQVKILVGGEPHVAIARGTAAQNRVYCTKEESRVAGPWEHGKMPQPGKRTDLEGAVEVAATEGIAAACEAYPGTMARYHRGVHFVVNTMRGKRRREEGWRPIEIRVITGPPCVGKSRIAREYPDVYEVPSHDSGVWFDGYDGEKTLLFDDFYGGAIKQTHLLKILDGYPRQEQVKGSYAWLDYDLVIIVSNREPFQWYEKPTHALFDRIYHRYGIALRVEREGEITRVMCPCDGGTCNGVRDTLSWNQ